MVQVNRFAGQKLRHRCREQTYGHQGGKVAGGGGGGVMNWEIGIDIYTLIRIKWVTNKNLLYKKINKNKIQKFNNKKRKKHEREYLSPLSKDTARRWLPANQEESPHQNPTMLAP